MTNHMTDLLFFTSFAAVDFYQDCSWLQTCKRSSGSFFERNTCSSFMVARTEGTLRCVQSIPKEKGAFFSLWSTSHYFSCPNVITISWSRWVTVTVKGTSCFLLIPWATSESAFSSSCAMKKLQFYFWKRNLYFLYWHAVKKRLYERFTTVMN